MRRFGTSREPPQRLSVKLLLSFLTGFFLCLLVAKAAIPTRVSVYNALPTPVEISLDDGRSIRLGPGQSRTVWRYLPPRVTWFALAPAGGSLELGERLYAEIPPPETSLIVYRVFVARYRTTIDYRLGHRRFYAPLVTNLTRETIRVEFKSAGGPWTPCSCEIRTGSRSTFLGYYPFDERSALRVVGRRGILTNIASVASGAMQQGGVLDVTIR